MICEKLNSSTSENKLKLQEFCPILAFGHRFEDAGSGADLDAEYQAGIVSSHNRAFTVGSTNGPTTTQTKSVSFQLRMRINHSH